MAHICIIWVGLILKHFQNSGPLWNMKKFEHINCQPKKKFNWYWNICFGRNCPFHPQIHFNTWIASQIENIQIFVWFDIETFALGEMRVPSSSYRDPSHLPFIADWCSTLLLRLPPNKPTHSWGQTKFNLFSRCCKKRCCAGSWISFGSNTQ